MYRRIEPSMPRRLFRWSSLRLPAQLTRVCQRVGDPYNNRGTRFRIHRSEYTR